MADTAAYRAVGTLYNALMTALILGLVTRRGEDTAREYVFRHFRHQHLEKFLPGLQKLGIAATLDAFVLTALLGHKNVSVYDNSMQEWSNDQSLPMETG